MRDPEKDEVLWSVFEEHHQGQQVGEVKSLSDELPNDWKHRLIYKSIKKTEIRRR